MTKKKSFYVGITDPVSTRKNILETSKSLIQILQKYEKLKDIKYEKHKEMTRLHELIKRISVDLTEMKRDLPQYSLSELPKKKEPKFVPAKQLPKKAVKSLPAPEKPKVSELDRLEKDLGSIENKLGKL